MRVLIFGGAGSGKSEYAEQLACQLGREGQLVYLATMSARDPESLARIQRHRLQRAGNGFTTIERPSGLARLQLPLDSVALLEDLSNLAANELFLEGQESKLALQEMQAGISHLERQARHLIVVGNDLFSDGVAYDAGTQEYLHLLAQLQSWLAGRFDQVIEVVCGLPVVWKGAGV